MALSDLRQFYFYQKYLWSPADFTNFQMWLSARFEGMFEGLLGAAVLSGLDVTISSGLTVNIAAGLAGTPSGRLMNLAAGTTKTLASPSGNPAKSLLVLRPKDTDSDYFPQPTNPSNSVPLYKKLESELVVLNGTPAADPVYPATNANDVVLMGFSLANGQTTLTIADFDWGVVSRPRKKTHKVLQKTASFNVSSDDELVEMDCSASGMIAVLPPLQSVIGREYMFVRTDGSANNIAVSGNGSDSIDGQTHIDLDTQYQKLRLIAGKSAWRAF